MPVGIYPRPSVEERFWDKVKKMDSGCWEWQGALVRNGYGNFWHNKEQIRAHRFAYEYFTGRLIPDGLEIDHLCRNHKCVNPRHLEAVTRRENVIRGIGPRTLINYHLAKNNCPKGHLYDLFNTYYQNGHRSCIICRRQAKAEYELKMIERKGRNE